MLEALLWGSVACSSLLIGATLGLVVDGTKPAVGLALGFGGGALISAVSFELADDALTLGGAGALAAGTAAGAFTYFGGSRALGRRNDAHPAAAAGGAGALLALGALLDGIPESAALGLQLSRGEGVTIALLAAIFVSNLPEALGSAAIMRKGGSTAREIFVIWSSVAIAGVVACVLGFVLLDGADPRVVAVVQAFAAGAILTMLADAMFPEAIRTGGDRTGLFTALGFTVALLISASE